MNIEEMAFKDINNDNINIDQDQDQGSVENKSGPPQKSFWDIITTKTGQGNLENYIDNPLNYDNTKETGQVLRGLSGFTGDLDLAVVDIIMGIFRKASKKKGLTSQNE